VRWPLSLALLALLLWSLAGLASADVMPSPGRPDLPDTPQPEPAPIPLDAAAGAGALAIAALALVGRERTVAAP
jgi:hypothetical protein